MKKSIVFLLISLLTSCGTVETYKALPPDKRIDFLKTEAIKFLGENKGVFKQALVIAGSEALSQGVSPEERQAIANQMYAFAVAFRSLATGQAITADQVTNTIESFGGHAPGYVKFANEAGILWATIFPKLQLSESQQLALDYLEVFALAAEEVGGSYKQEAQWIL